MQFHIVSAFPEMFGQVLNTSILRRARESQAVSVQVHDLREYALDKHKSVDDAPFGGGPGMILKPEPLFLCTEDLISRYELDAPHILLTAADGTRFDQRYANRLALEEKPVILLCGHYKGVDERVRTHLATGTISIGDYVLTGGELPAMVVVDAVTRLLPGVIGDIDSALTDSFQGDTLDCPQYTRPQNFRNMPVPEVLLSGHHEKIEAWREQQSKAKTKQRRGNSKS